METHIQRLVETGGGVKSFKECELTCVVVGTAPDTWETVIRGERIMFLGRT